MPKNESPKIENSPLKILQVIDQLEVGPSKLEQNRIITPYKIIQNNNEHVVDLIYKYEDNVFDTDDFISQNLASIIGAQVAMNYGLFCKKIIFKGLLTDLDRRFISDKMENTAKEIYVKKILEPNPFLLKDYRNLPHLKLNHYSQADLLFPQLVRKQQKVPWRLWETTSKKHAILSSGGKDSLLSYGLMNEIGRETHPIFINESGRHWFTALNAYRHFKVKIPNTARVWTNSDRVFNVMVRHLPFIRKDFSQIRSDEYPIRLWTVAVFLFGALPILRKKQIGRLIIGDEHDTTVRLKYKGIPHYDGLYDQSRYFDYSLTRYFLKKGWGICQFSIVRPLSEMLIEKILVNRYPHLHELQTSCHATHKEGNRVYPCGKCEKCRRIVSMIVALSADPTKCGYTAKQIAYCLNDLAKKGVHQESAGEQHLLYTLIKKNKIKITHSKKKSIKAHPEILKLRFDNEKSPVETIPVDLRIPLYRIFMKNADGAVKKTGKKWIEFKLLKHNSLKNPYPFEISDIDVKEKSFIKKVDKENLSKNYIFGELTWPDVEYRLKETDIALLPVGAIEQHGPHLPLDTDSFDADYLAKHVAEACSIPKPFVLPPIYYGVSYHHDDFKGTMSISNETLSKMVYEIGMSAARNGIKKLVIINGHGGNGPSLNFAAQMINRDSKIFACVDTGETSDVDIYDIVETPNDVHAGEFETSTTLATRPELVKIDRAKRMVPKFSSRYLNFTSKRGVLWYAHTKKLSKLGIMGDPTKASAQKGKKMWKIMIAHLVTFVEDLKRMTLEEIYQKRY